MKRKSENISGNKTADTRELVKVPMAVENVKNICEEQPSGMYDLEVIDIYQDKAKNLADLVLATPTQIKKLPLPFRKVIGDMNWMDKVLVGLDLVLHQ